MVEFGERVEAAAVMAGGQSGDPASKHFADQIDHYSQGRLRPIDFYPDELAGTSSVLTTPVARAHGLLARCRRTPAAPST